MGKPGGLRTESLGLRLRTRGRRPVAEAEPSAGVRGDASTGLATSCDWGDSAGL